MDHIRLGIVGYGYWGPNLVRNYVSLANVKVVSVADKRTDRLQNVNSLFPQIRVTQEYRDFFELDLDAAVIATPPATHFQIAKDCLENNLHTFVEKPMTLCSRDAEALIELADQRDLVLMVGHTFEYNPAVRMIKELIASGDLGQVYYINTVRVSLGLFQPDLNVLWDLAPHDISILRYLLSEDPIGVRAMGEACIFCGKHDIAYLHLEYPDGILAHLHLSWLDPCKVRRITVVGSQKMLVYDDLESVEKIKIYDKGVEKLPYTNTFGEFQCSYRYGDIVIPHVQFTEPLKIECQHFIDCIQDRCMQPLTSGREGLKVVQILEAAQRSLENDGQRQPFPGIELEYPQMITTADIALEEQLDN